MWICTVTKPVGKCVGIKGIILPLEWKQKQQSLHVISTCHMQHRSRGYTTYPGNSNLMWMVLLCSVSHLNDPTQSISTLTDHIVYESYTSGNPSFPDCAYTVLHYQGLNRKPMCMCLIQIQTLKFFKSMLKHRHSHSYMQPCFNINRHAAKSAHPLFSALKLIHPSSTSHSPLRLLAFIISPRVTITGKRLCAYIWFFHKPPVTVPLPWICSICSVNEYMNILFRLWEKKENLSNKCRKDEFASLSEETGKLKWHFAEQKTVLKEGFNWGVFFFYDVRH